MTKCFLFVLRLSYSGKAVHRVTASAGQEAYFEGHVHAFRVLGGVPTGKVRYDNLRAAVTKVVGLSWARVENQRWVAFRSHHHLEAFYCRPGKDGAHEKGGVEGEVGRFRRNHLVPVPVVESLAELNAMIAEWEAEDDQRRIGSRARTVAADFAVEQPLPAPLPDEPFETGRVFHPRVNRRSQICVRMNYYSVPVRLIGRQVRVLLHASELVVFDGRTQVARHERLVAKHQCRLDLDHYLEILMRKPGALPGSTALEQARQAGKFTPVHDAWWAAVRRAHGDAEGTRALIEVLLLHRSMAHEHVVAGIATALRVGALTPAMAGFRVKYVLAAKLVNELVEAADELVLNKTITRYGPLDLLCIDELGYMELDKRGADLLFQVLTEHEEKASVAIASNESFGAWTNTFTDPRLCGAIVDRLTFNATIIDTGSDSHRRAHTRARQATEPA